ncbi:hypothetical protein GCM10027290_40720 [Micromonospora sonneratiae]|uniref:Peptidase MA superfamily n=1 Tax=Micromonospora sonneratiae TaxID=1184706 RepID=A0ABW3YP17_9ACTN
MRQQQRGAGICGGWSRRSLLLSTGLLVAGCSKPERPKLQDQGSQSTGEPTAQGLQALLNQRAEALQKGDEAAFLVDLDQNNGKLVEQQKLLFTNLRKLKLTTFQYIASQANDRPEGEVHRFMPVHEVVQLTADAGPGGVAPATSYRYSVVRRDGRLVITEILPVTKENAEELNAYNSLPGNAPWHLTPLTVQYVDNACLIGDGSVSDLQRYADAARGEIQHVESLWGDRLRFPGYVLFLTRDEENFKKWYSLGSASNFKPEVEGFQIPQYGVRQNGDIYNGQYAGSRVVVNLRTIANFNDDPRRVIRHEFAHSIGSRATTLSPGGWVLGAPTWAVEGFARWTEQINERPFIGSRVAAGAFKGRLPTSKDFYGKESAFNYALSSTVFYFVERRKGRSAAVELYASVIKYNDTEGQPMAEAPIFNAICKRVLGMTSSAFIQQWASFVRNGA